MADRVTGVDPTSVLSDETRRWLGPLGTQLPSQFRIYEDESARSATRHIGAAAFTRQHCIFIGDVPPEHRELVLRHELVHLAQVQVALRTGCISSASDVESEADAVSVQPTASLVPLRRSSGQSASVHSDTYRRRCGAVRSILSQARKRTWAEG